MSNSKKKNNSRTDKIKRIHETIDELLVDDIFDESEPSVATTQIEDTIGSRDEKAERELSYDRTNQAEGLVTVPMPKSHSISRLSFNKYSFQDVVDLYKSVGTRNADFLFNWLYSVYDKIFLPSIDLDWKETLTLDKAKLTIIDVLIDDLADDVKMRNRRLLEEATEIPWHGPKNYNNDYLQVISEMWFDCINSIRRYPRFKDFEDVFYFDLHQVINSFRYSLLVNTSNFSNHTEDRIYLSHGVMVLLHCNMDLMCSPCFNFKEMGKLRPILILAQDIAHIGNMLNTYPKEIEELDLSSPIISLGLRKGLINKNMIIKSPENATAKLRELVPYFEKRMENDLNRIKNNAIDIESIDIHDFYKKLKDVSDKFLKRQQYWKNPS